MKYRDGYKYQLAEDLTLYTRIKPVEDITTEFITLLVGGTMTFKSGYAWDGASGPTWDTDNSMTPSLYHDGMAQLMRMGKLDLGWLDYVNEEFDDMLKERGMNWFRRRLWRRGLWLTGGSFAEPENAKEVFEVP